MQELHISEEVRRHIAARQAERENANPSQSCKKKRPIAWGTFSKLVFGAPEIIRESRSNSFYAPITWGCENPVTVGFYAFAPIKPWSFSCREFTIVDGVKIPMAIKSSITVEAGAKHWLDLDVPCRKCKVCKDYAQKKWVARSVAETLSASRTWFTTFTLRPTSRQRIALRAGSWKFEDMLPYVGKEVTKALKRLRKHTKAKVRYLIAFEPHKDGVPHVHLLLHQIGAVRLLKKDIRRCWLQGNVDTVLVKDADGAAGYVCKYVCKSPFGRVRASIRYGSIQP